MLFSLLSGSLEDVLFSLLLSLPVVLLALSVHESAHGYAAWKCGDSTAYNLGRLTLNPFRHLDPVGFLFMLLFGFGWAKPVPINTHNFRNPKRGMAITAAAGPFSNLCMGVGSAFLYGVAWAYYNYLYYAAPDSFLATCIFWLSTLFYMGALFNFMLMAFNLIPVPPFDGSRMALIFLPSKIYFGIMKYERQIMFGILIVLLLLSRLFDFSPFSWLAEKLTFSIFDPVSDFFWEHVFRPLLLK